MKPRESIVTAFFTGSFILLIFCGSLSANSPQEWQNYKETIEPLLEEYCFDCHAEGIKKGGMNFDLFSDLKSMHENRKQWKKVQDNLRFHLMPPPDEAQPSEEERQEILHWVKHAVFPVDPKNPDPGRITIRRLNRLEYVNSIYSLTKIHPGTLINILPPDDSGHGFDNNADVLTLSPQHIENYLTIAETVLEKTDEKNLYLDANNKKRSNLFIKETISWFAKRAYRRKLNDEEIQQLVSFFKKVDNPENDLNISIKKTYSVILTSPHFLFRELENLDQSNQTTQLVSETTLASRISYFLTGTIPTEHMLKLAEKGILRQNLTKVIDQTLKKEYSANYLAEAFFSQWLRTGNVRLVFRHPKHYGSFSRHRHDFANESFHFFKNLISKNESVMDIIDADYSYLNEYTAKHYGIKGVKGKKFQRVSLKDSPRRGVFTHTSVLASTAHAQITSPVNRGKWVLETILNQTPPPPPQNVTDLSQQKKSDHSSLRKQLEAHREDPACSACHKMMDGIGFAFERYDSIGRWIPEEKTKEIDTSGELHTGEQFANLNELIDIILSEKKDDFLRSMSEKLLTFALGRGVEYYDEPAINEIVRKVQKDPRMHTMIHAVIESTPFQKRRGTQSISSIKKS